MPWASKTQVRYGKRKTYLVKAALKQSSSSFSWLAPLKTCSQTLDDKFLVTGIFILFIKGIYNHTIVIFCQTLQFPLTEKWNCRRPISYTSPHDFSSQTCWFIIGGSFYMWCLHDEFIQIMNDLFCQTPIYPCVTDYGTKTVRILAMFKALRNHLCHNEIWFETKLAEYVILTKDTNWFISLFQLGACPQIFSIDVQLSTPNQCHYKREIKCIYFIYFVEFIFLPLFPIRDTLQNEEHLQ